MDFETPDGSQFWLSEVWTEREDGDGDFEYTTISALVNGNAYAGKTQQPMEDINEAEILKYLEIVPPENVFPLMPPNFTRASEINQKKHYLKGPQFTYEECEPGKTFVADCLLSEAKVLEHLRTHPHPNIISYHGCVAKDGRITNICLERCTGSLPEFCENEVSNEVLQRILAQIKLGIEHLHSLGLAHNDINPDNICIDQDGNAIIVDFDACTPFGEALLKGVVEEMDDGDDASHSCSQNDLNGLKRIEEFLRDCVEVKYD